VKTVRIYKQTTQVATARIKGPPGKTRLDLSDICTWLQTHPPSSQPARKPSSVYTHTYIQTVIIYYIRSSPRFSCMRLMVYAGCCRIAAAMVFLYSYIAKGLTKYIHMWMRPIRQLSHDISYDTRSNVIACHRARRAHWPFRF